MAEVNLGVIAPVPKGEWNGETIYQPLNIVRLREALYMAIETSQGIEPLVTTGWQNYWMLLFNQSSSVIPALESIAIGQIVLLDNPTNPYELYGGGQWLQIKDTFLLTAGDNYNAGEVGGSENHNHTLENGFAHARLYYNGASYDAKYTNVWKSDINVYYENFQNSDGEEEDQDVGTALGGTTDNSSNMPPYLVVYAWKRIA